MDLNIVYQNENLVVINKPSGLLVHPTVKKRGDTLLDELIKRYPEIRGVGEKKVHGRPSYEATERHGIVHRLDKDTSGLLVIAKTQESYEKLKELFKQRKIKKRYFALVWGSPKRDKGIIKKEIKAYKGKRQTVEKYSQIETKKARPSETRWSVIKRYSKFTLLGVEPLTGRTHQIRVHLDSIGLPVVCDKLYGKKKLCPPELGRLFLHAYFLQIPYDGTTILEFEEDMPQDLGNFLKYI